MSSSKKFDRVQAKLNELILALSSVQMNGQDPNKSFDALGISSPVLLHLSQILSKQFETKITFRQLIEHIESPHALTRYLVDVVSDEVLERDIDTSLTPPSSLDMSQVAAHMPRFPSLERPPENLVEELKKIMAQQLHVMSMQLAMLTETQPTSSPTPQHVEFLDVGKNGSSKQVPSLTLHVPPPADDRFAEIPTPKPLVFPPVPILDGEEHSIANKREAHISPLIERFLKKTAASKRIANQQPSHTSDTPDKPSSETLWANMVYPISSERTSGSKRWDVDGNEYIDFDMRGGTDLFGHAPGCITEAVSTQLQQGLDASIVSALTKEVTHLLRDTTGHASVALFNSAREALSSAVHYARERTGKSKIVFFNGASHPSADPLLVRSKWEEQSLHLYLEESNAPATALHEAIVLDYGDPRSLHVIQAYASEVACVLVGGFQQHRPDYPSQAFLDALRSLASEYNIAFILDETVSGFRSAPGGAQEYLKIDADIAIYGDMLGGGLALGALAGKTDWMTSNIQQETLRNGQRNGQSNDLISHEAVSGNAPGPLSMAASRAFLVQIQQQGPTLQEALNTKTQSLAEELNTFFEQRNVPLQLLHTASLFRFAYASELEFINLLYYHLLDKGIYIKSLSDPCFLSTAHTDEEIEHFIYAVKSSIIALQEGAFLPEPLDEEQASSTITLQTSDLQPALEEHADFEEVETERNTEFDTVAEHEQESEALPLDDTIEIQAEALVPINVLEEESEDGDTVQSFPLTEVQKDIWHITQAGEEASCAFNDTYSIRLRGNVYEEALQVAIQQTILRHEAFHLRFAYDGEAQYRVDPEILDIEITNASEQDTREQQNILATVKQSFASTPFNLSEGPLVRFSIIKLAEDDVILFCSTHRLICDNFSRAVLFEEISLRYNALQQNTEIALPPAPLFSEYLIIESDRQRANAYNDSYTYWVKQCTPFPAALVLPSSRPRNLEKTFQGATLNHDFTPRLSAAIKQTADEQGIALFTLLLSTVHILLSRLTQQDDIVVIVPVSRHAQLGHESWIGHCSNQLPIRSSVHREQSCKEFFSHMEAIVHAAYEHKGCTLSGILKRLSIAQDGNRLPLSEVGFHLDSLDTPTSFIALEHTISLSSKTSVASDLFFNIVASEDALHLTLDYNAHLFDEDTIAGWVKHFEALLEGVHQNDESLIGALPTHIDEQPVVQPTAHQPTLSGLEVDYPLESTVHSLFMEQVQKSADAIALTFENTRLTYKDLDEYSNQFSRFLTERGVGTGMIVGVHMEKSAGMLVALLGILKSGGAYMPIDPAYPLSRIQLLIQDANLNIILSEKDLLASIKSLSLNSDVSVICLDDERENIAKHARTPQKVAMNSSECAYVVYTSGPSGKPRGVEVTHRSLVNLLCAIEDHPGFTSDDVLLSISNLSFDIAALELFLPILTGGTVVIATREMAMDGNLLAKAIQEYDISVLQATPATWNMLLTSGWEGKSDLTMLSGGEALSPDLARALHTRGASLWNLYGPTEATVWSSLYETTIDDAGMHIGMPIPNVHFFILDENLLPVPEGSTGELYIGGEGLAKGYLGLSDLTKERFIDYSSDDTVKRLFKTGDLVKVHHGGHIECVGRNDELVKIRGFRIDPGEVETALMSLPSISRAVVTVREDEDRSKSLVGYLESPREEPIDVKEVRAALRAELPQYMIPTHFITVQDLPSSPDDSIDHKALPSLDAYTPPERPIQEPRTPTERLIADAWSNVLHIDRIGVNDNFFDLGGHSLHATRVIALLQEPLQLDLPFRVFYQNPTVSSLALAITELQASQESDDDIMKMIEELEDLSEEEISALLRDNDS